MNIFTKIKNCFFGENQKNGFLVQSIKYHTESRDITPEGGRWKEVELGASSVEVVLSSTGFPNLAVLAEACKEGSVVVLTVIKPGKSKQILSQDVKYISL